MKFMLGGGGGGASNLLETSGVVNSVHLGSCASEFRWAVWLRLRSALRERARQVAHSGPGTQGASVDLDVPLT
jgi:hypothetical protein